MPQTPALVWVPVQLPGNCWQIWSPKISHSGIALLPLPWAGPRVKSATKMETVPLEVSDPGVEEEARRAAAGPGG